MEQKPQRHGKRWRIRVVRDGVVTRPSYDTEEEALAALAMEGQPTLADLIEDFSVARWSNATNRNTRKAIMTTMNHIVGSSMKYPAELTSAGLIALFGGREKAIAKSTLKTYMKHVGWLLQYMEEIRGIKIDLDLKKVSKYIQVHTDKREKEYFTAEDVLILFNFYKKNYPEYYPMIRLMAFCGIRIGAATQLKCKDLDTENGTLVVPAHIEKSRKEMVYHLPESIFKEINSNMAEILGQHDYPGEPDYDFDKPLFYHHNNFTPISASGFSQRFSEHCREMKLGKRNIHLLRAFAFAQLYEQSGHNLEMVKQIVGWDSESYKYYVGTFEQERKSIAVGWEAEMENLANGVTKPYGFFHEGSWHRFSTVAELQAFAKRWG